ncbi:unnamed protein product [Cylicocyclus nassatus]|uniref:Uncharacterized protein n=1 Tax=Cylicocyclus nassatus TaxID=53992 RepID=A0AA36MFX5_CYLNA|nr:unnamed protein product [Cylicocyclus nassatus]
MYYKLIRKHRPCRFTSAISEFRQKKSLQIKDMQDIAHEFVEMAKLVDVSEYNEGVKWFRARRLSAVRRQSILFRKNADEMTMEAFAVIDYATVIPGLKRSG